MDKEKFRGIRKNIFIIVCLTALIFLASGAVIGIWSAGEMKELVVEQFNEEQLVIARNVSNLIERELSFLKKEILLLRKDISVKP